MRQNRDLVMQWILASEGGYVNHPKDPGGATNFGVTQRTYDAWRWRKQLPARSVRQITMDEVHAIYAEGYLDRVRFDDLPAGVDYAVADYAVNSGPGRAIKELQRLLRVADDGVIGPITMTALDRAHPARLIHDLCTARMAFLRRLRHWPTFGRGWTRRVMGDEEGVQEGDIGVIDRATRLAIAMPALPAPRAVAPGKAPAASAAPWWARIIAAIRGLFGSDP